MDEWKHALISTITRQRERAEAAGCPIPLPVYSSFSPSLAVYMSHRYPRSCPARPGLATLRRQQVEEDALFLEQERQLKLEQQRCLEHPDSETTPSKPAHDLKPLFRASYQVASNLVIASMADLLRDSESAIAVMRRNKKGTLDDVL